MTEEYWQNKVRSFETDSIEEIPPKCACGCGEFVRLNKHKRFNRFIHNHHTRMRYMTDRQNWAREKKFALTGKRIWNEGLTKETDSRVKKGTERTVMTKKRLFAEGKIQPTKYWKGKKMSPKSPLHTLRKSIAQSRRWKEDLAYREKMMKCRRSRILPMKDTSIEVKIQDYLRELGIEFLTHQYMKEIEHGYQCDILIPSKKVIIECDGDYWHANPYFFKLKNKPIPEYIANRRRLDWIRRGELLLLGYTVLNLWECGIRSLTFVEFKEILENTLDKKLKPQLAYFKLENIQFGEKDEQ